MSVRWACLACKSPARIRHGVYTVNFNHLTIQSISFFSAVSKSFHFHWQKFHFFTRLFHSVCEQIYHNHVQEKNISSELTRVTTKKNYTNFYLILDTETKSLKSLTTLISVYLSIKRRVLYLLPRSISMTRGIIKAFGKFRTAAFFIFISPTTLISRIAFPRVCPPSFSKIVRYIQKTNRIVSI